MGEQSQLAGDNQSPFYAPGPWTPTTSCDRIEDFVAAYNTGPHKDLSVAWKEIEPAGSIALVPARTNEPKHFWHFNSGLGDVIEYGRTYLASLSNIRSLVLNNQALCLFHPNGELLADVDTQQSSGIRLSVLGRELNLAAIDIEQPILLPVGRHYQNYWHYLTGLAPLLGSALAARLELGSFSFMGVNSISESYQIDILNSLKMSLPRIVPMATDVFCCLKRCTVISQTGDERAVAPWKVDFLRSRFLNRPAPATPSKKIFITRKGSARRFVNEDEICDLLQSFGFTILRLEGKSVAEQASIFSQAEVIVAAHGSALANSVFASPGVKVLEIISPYYLVDYFRPLVSVVGGKYYYMIGEGERLTECDIEKSKENYFVSPEKLTGLLSLAGVTR